ncbi:sensor histidine kinase [Mesobacillus selenatarsenatis]|uniref:histidine kinase n=1 Tax=Mesobacillus selenatarsenatis (strain DSM 18680 / JCM 14380 / FERM P-15431 / SF-1) TaxID=1321606 RepID=A0A0A8XC91_MESS1|nr:HAMP domain-containing sensor histidine kinase [Mesobacillus selenatarsenatis]GAM16642.1 signal transduction histidine kinase [Mesobacillus selenatarsenatis SF-1]
MTIKYRLILSYLAMVFVPLILFFLAGLLLMFLFLGDIREVSDLMPESHDYKKTISEDTKLFGELKEKSFVDPEGLANIEYLSVLSAELEQDGIFIVLRQGNEVIYSSQKTAHLSAAALPEFGVSSTSRIIEKIGKETYSLRQHDFYIPEKGSASLFLIKDASSLTRLMRTFYPILFVMLILILIITNGLLTYYVSRSIIKPIEQLKEAAKKIKEGNLDHTINVNGKDELAQLSADFEAMRKKLQESAEIQAQYEKNRKELIAHISHDLKTPITSIKGYVEGIRDGVTNSPEKLERYLQTIHQKSMDMDTLINELFLYSKLDLKKLPFDFEEVDLKDYLIDYLEELAFDLEKKNVKLNFEYDANDSYPVSIDREKLKRVFSNIIENSLKYMDKENGEITISLYENQNEVILELADNGPGISNESLPFIFQQFYREEGSRNKETGGSGLGLSIAGMIIEEHGGTITAESSLGIGTRIIISLERQVES